MTDKKCDGIDCAWCANPECPNERNNMTDKIMIDGVDVSGCEFLQETLGITACHKDFSPCNKGTEREYLCANSPNCYYKQLQRTQTQYNAVVEQNKSLQQKVKELEEQLTETKFFDLFSEEIISKLNTDEMLTNHFKNLIKYKQTLEEIKKLIQTATYCESQWCTCNSPEECLDCTRKLILQKCEVLDD